MSKSKLLYLFAITQRLDDNTKQEVQEIGFSLIEHQDIQCLVQEVSTEEFEEQALSQNLQNLEWLQAKALWHDQQIAQLLPLLTSLLPLKFGTIFESEESLKIHLKQDVNNFQEILERIRGHSEWALKVFVNPTKFEENIEDSTPQLHALATEIAEAKPGKAYMLKKKYDKLHQEDLQKQRIDILDAIYRDLASEATDTKLKPLSQQPETNNDEVFVLNTVFLIQDNLIDKWKEQVQKMADSHLENGIRLTISGPWAAYHFTQITK